MIIIEKKRIGASSELPQILDDFDNAQTIDTCFSKGFYSIPDNDDEVLVVNSFNDPRQKVAIGVIENGLFGLTLGDRLIITDGAAILLKKNGTIRVDATAKVLINSASEIELNAPIVNINATNINANGGFAITGTGTLNGSDIATV
jgi:phage gp45-like